MEYGFVLTVGIEKMPGGEMGAKETVMNRKKKHELILERSHQQTVGNETQEDMLLKAQDEISFKAGQNSGYDKGYAQAKEDLALLVLEAGLDKELKQAGIREVVEWIRKNRETPLGKDPYGYYVWEVALDAQCKEWGL